MRAEPPTRRARWRLRGWAGVAVASASTFFPLAVHAVDAPVAHAQADPAAPDHVQSFGGAAHVGSLATLTAASVAVADESVVALVPTTSGGGYWIVLADGSVYTFGDGAFAGSLPGLRAAGAALDPALVIVAMAATPSGNGYWLVDDRGGVYAFGDAGFFGSLPGLQGAGLVAPGVRVVAMAATPSGNGYWLVDDRGGVYAFGDAGFFGSGAAEPVSEPVVGFASTGTGDGYRILTADGLVRSYGAAPDHGSAVVPPDRQALTLSSSPAGSGYWVVTPQDRAAADAPALPPNSGEGRRIVYSNSRQRVWLVDASGVVSGSWLVSGRRGVPAPGTYHVFSKSPASSAGSLRLDHMTRFARGRRLAIGFHAIPTAGGRPIQGLNELGEYRSHGCVRQAPADAARLYAWAPIGTTVVVTP